MLLEMTQKNAKIVSCDIPHYILTILELPGKQNIRENPIETRFNKKFVFVKHIIAQNKWCFEFVVKSDIKMPEKVWNRFQQGELFKL